MLLYFYLKHYMEYRIYWDETCHLPADQMEIMWFWAILIKEDMIEKYKWEILEIKKKYHAMWELKSSRIWKQKYNFYTEIIDWFFLRENISFRSVIVTDKKILNHWLFNEWCPSTFYFKMYYYLLDALISKANSYKILLDIQNTRSWKKINHLKNILRNRIWDEKWLIIQHVEQVHSDESPFSQLADFFLWLVAYKHRWLKSSIIKLNLIKYIEEKSGWDLLKQTTLSECKFNRFNFIPSKP